jgi:hypothetical protein
MSNAGGPGPRHATAKITHGGSATTLPALSCGLRVIVIPMFALDQYPMARRVQAVGAGVALPYGPAELAELHSGARVEESHEGRVVRVVGGDLTS